jgi:hypothetical protein
MNGRTPNAAERLYIDACVCSVGCIACILDGRDIENPQAWTEFHHDPDFGSDKPGAHFHGYGLCPAHHRGVFNDRNIAAISRISVRHPAYGSNSTPFAWRYGSDAELCRKSWSLLPESVKARIGYELENGGHLDP